MVLLIIFFMPQCMGWWRSSYNVFINMLDFYDATIYIYKNTSYDHAYNKLSQENFKEAEKHARKCFKLVPNDPRVLSVYGEVLVRIGQVDKGLEALERAYKLNPIASGKTNEDHRLSSILLGNFMARNRKDCIAIISKLDSIVFLRTISTNFP